MYVLFHLPLTNAISMIRNTMIKNIKKITSKIQVV
jgi:hypothetical protein